MTACLSRTLRLQRRFFKHRPPASWSERVYCLQEHMDQEHMGWTVWEMAKVFYWPSAFDRFLKRYQERQAKIGDRDDPSEFARIGIGGLSQPGRRGEAMKTAEVVGAPSSPRTRIWGLRIAWHSMTSSMPASKSNSEVSSSAEVSMAYILSDRTPMVQGQAASQSQLDQHDVNHGLGVKERLGSCARALGGWCWVKHPKL